METVTILVCKKEIQTADKIWIGEYNDWNLSPSAQLLELPGFVAVKRELEKPDWLDLSIEEATNKGLMNQVVRGIWILEIESRTVLACFRGAENFVDKKVLDVRFVENKYNFGTEDLIPTVLRYMKQAVKSN